MEMQHTVLVFQPYWSLQAIYLEILFLGQEFDWIFVCKCWESFEELVSPTLELKVHCSGYSILYLFKNVLAENFGFY